ncbi:FtsK/SpoIIIE family DNA translocase [Fulvivirga sedimenti]|uniref:DNA translocase FtsK n=1 Tax=Fulvivirga sedimenti TaxID=2879465 RepID=A0A9X1HMA0_9BACT|nr:DNA translocase FtsK [Fulvivirga sedimenti]MCA6074006.1 DNA translocase FtsK [Fulvivirga sedimenti]
MAKNTYKKNTVKAKPTEKKARKKLNLAFWKDRRFQLTFGFFLIIIAIFLFTACISYLFTGKADQSVVMDSGSISGNEAENWLGLTGAIASHILIFLGFGISTLLIPPFLYLLGHKIVFKKSILPLNATFTFCVFFMVWVSVLMGYLVYNSEGVSQWGYLSGEIGFEMAVFLESLMGWGTLLLLVFALFVFIIYFFNVTQVQGIKSPWSLGKSFAGVMESDEESDESAAGYPEEEDNWPEHLTSPEVELATSKVERPAQPAKPKNDLTLDVDLPEEKEPEPPKRVERPEPKKEEPEPEFSIEESAGEEEKADKQENYDPTLDLASYKYPTLDLLNQYDAGKIQVTKEELEQNKDKIIETLVNFKIGISSIKATIGPTVTLYEIVPEAGIKISKIKNLEDDIALSLAALGIRIIAPIPGKGTIGIEVPNKNREMVGINSVLSTNKFMHSDMELPVALGKTISNEVHIIDLAKMPHLLMAGATGQGKSVGLNVLLTSLLYKKHPSQLKFVLVDPKKVELSLFNKIERHFLAKLPNSEEAIITDTKKVVYTLNSLCIEMDARYDLLKEGGARNLKEYNAKFVSRRLNPEKGHRFLPYIVLVIDELADLMMTAGKEVETPIARLAQLARAIGIHLVVATQRPSVNVITGVIKANFPARLSFRVTSKIDSRTILDTGGADQLIGMGDMLLSQGSDLIRLQCAFVDTPEVERICDYIGEQRGYETAYLLPEFEGDEDSSVPGEVDLSDRDVLFEDAARLIVLHQQGSTSLIQRKLKLGYNRAGRLIDQLEAAGIVGPFEGSKARDVLIPDEYSLEQLLNELN